MASRKLKFNGHDGTLFSPAKIWWSFFLLWAMFLSGIFSNSLGSPGVRQALSIQKLLSQKQYELRKLEAEVESFSKTKLLLENDLRAQENEIRKVLGYVGEDELVIEFSSPTVSSHE